MADQESFGSLRDFEEAARKLWRGKGLAAVIEASSAPDGFRVRFEPCVNRSLPPAAVRERLDAICHAPQPNWKIQSCLLKELCVAACRKESYSPITIVLTKGQGGIGVWSLAISSCDLYDSDIDLEQLVSRVVGTLKQR